MTKSHPQLTAHRLEMTRYSLGAAERGDRRRPSIDVQNRMVDFGIDAFWLSHEPWLVPEPFTPEAGEMWSKEDIDYWIDVLAQISDEAYADPELVKTAPHNQAIHQLTRTGSRTRAMGHDLAGLPPQGVGMIPLLPADAAPLRGVEERGGRVNNLYRKIANNPTLLEAWTEFAWTLRGECATPRTLRELLILRAAQLARSRYLWDDHVRFGKEAGLTDERIAQLGVWRESPLYDEDERAALAFTDQLVERGGAGDDVLAALESRFTPSEVVELTLTVSFYTMAPRVIEALRVPLMYPDDPPAF